MVWVDKYIHRKDIGKMKYKKSKIPRPKRAFSFSEILARIEWYVNTHKGERRIKNGV
jgi:hypothetical protein